MVLGLVIGLVTLPVAFAVGWTAGTLWMAYKYDDKYDLWDDDDA